MAGNAVPNASKDLYKGRITWVHASAIKISVRPQGADVGGQGQGIPSTSFIVTAETKVTLNGEPKTRADIQKGQNVVVTPKVGKLDTAAEIALTDATGASKPAEKKE